MTTSNTVFPTESLCAIDFDDAQTTNVYSFPNEATVVQTTMGPVIWGKASAAITEGQVCYGVYSSGVMTMALVTTTTSGSTGTDVYIAHKAVASGSYGWFFGGPFTDVQVLLLTTISADAQITTTATAGSGGGGGDNIFGLFANASSGSGGLTLCKAIGKMGTNLAV